MFLLFQVCGEQAARHIHYGGVSCYSCRAFFRRSIQNKTASTYICRRSQECQINKQTRKNCQFCRWVNKKQIFALDSADLFNNFLLEKLFTAYAVARDKDVTSFVPNTLSETRQWLQRLHDAPYCMLLQKPPQILVQNCSKIAYCSHGALTALNAFPATDNYIFCVMSFCVAGTSVAWVSEWSLLGFCQLTSERGGSEKAKLLKSLKQRMKSAMTWSPLQLLTTQLRIMYYLWFLALQCPLLQYCRMSS